MKKQIGDHFVSPMGSEKVEDQRERLRQSEGQRMKYGCPNVVDGKVCGCEYSKYIEAGKEGKWNSFGQFVYTKVASHYRCINCGHEFTEPVEVE